MESADVENLLLPIIEKEAIELVEVVLAGNKNHRVIKVFIDKKGGITVKECVNVSNQLSAVIDIEYDNENYILEVSSPGLDRPLKNRKDFLRCMGKKVLVDFYDDEGKIKKSSGIIVDTDTEYVKIEGVESINSISYNNIVKAILEIRF